MKKRKKNGEKKKKKKEEARKRKERVSQRQEFSPESLKFQRIPFIGFSIYIFLKTNFYCG